MCGIAGLIFKQPRELGCAVTRPLMSALSHRGPDDFGWLTYKHGETEKGRELPCEFSAQVFLGHQRLSILDLSSAGWQPMSSPDGKHHLIFNGEVYNFIELREELKKLGHHFVSGSDTEVLVAALKQWDVNCLPRLRGMFAFAYLDLERERLLLVRDAFGIKPLYYTRWEGGTAFASEIPSLLKLPGLSRRADAQRVFEFLRFGLTDHGQGTLFSNIQQLPSAHYVTVSLADAAPTAPVRYWTLSEESSFQGNVEEAAEELRERFVQSIKFHLRSDVPVGAALSGGIDSSAVVSAIRHVDNAADLHVFSFFADDPRISEESWSVKAANATGATLHPVRATPAELLTDLDALIAGQGEPFGSTSIYAQYRVFKAAKQAGIKVMLDGQGADEMLAGYLPYTSARLASLVRQSKWNEAWKFYRQASGLPGRGRLLLWLGQFCIPPKLASAARSMIGEQFYPSWMDRRWFSEQGVAPQGRYSFSSTKEVLKDQLSLTFAQTSLPMLLRYEDRNSMMHSIESRVPFLTADIVNFVFSLPEDFLISSSGRTKHVFRKAMSGLVPEEILQRQDKIGFETPGRPWLATMAPWVERNLQSLERSPLPMFNREELATDWKATLEDKRSFDWRIWRWNNLVSWARTWNVEFAQ